MSTEIATAIYKAYRNGMIDYETDPKTNAEYDVVYLGEGVSRMAFRSLIDGQVYKIPTGYGNKTINLHEAACSAYFRQNFRRPGIIWPDFKVHKVFYRDDDPEAFVWVSEVMFVEDDNSVSIYVKNRVLSLLYSIGVGDAGSSNVFSCKGFVIPIDLGYHALCSIDPWAGEVVPDGLIEAGYF